MVREFKKTGVATALTGALLAAASMSSQAAVQLSSPGDVLLVPYVNCDVSAASAVNTMVGLITFYKERLGLGSGTSDDPYRPAPALLANYLTRNTPRLPGVTRTPAAQDRAVHWYFYNTQSVHVLDGIIPVTDNDFVRFDWCSTLKTLNKLDDLGQGKTPGYMLFIDNRLDRLNSATELLVPSFALYGHSYMIAGNWSTQAFIPVISNPVVTYTGPNPDTDYIVNVSKRSGYPYIRRLVAGTDYTDIIADSATRQRDIYMRYFLDPSLATSNTMVFWFNSNSTSRTAPDGTTVPALRGTVAGETYDSEQNYMASFSVPIVNELNLLASNPTTPAFPGMLHQETEVYGGKFTVVNTGIIRFGVPEEKSNVSYSSSGVAFNMLGLSPDPATQPVQLQTEMATEGAEYPLF